MYILIEYNFLDVIHRFGLLQKTQRFRRWICFSLQVHLSMGNLVTGTDCVRADLCYCVPHLMWETDSPSEATDTVARN